MARRRGWLENLLRLGAAVVAHQADDARRRQATGATADKQGGTQGETQGDSGASGGKAGGKPGSNAGDTGAQQPPKHPVSPDLAENKAFLKSRLGESSDIVFRDFATLLRGGRRGFAVYINGLADDTKIIGLMTSVVDLSNPPHQHLQASTDPVMQFAEAVTRSPQVKIYHDLEKVLEGVLAGGAGIFFEGSREAMLGDSRWNPGRPVTEPSVETEVRGPRDGFVENIRLNTALIRRRIRDPRLTIEAMKIGTRTRTEVEILYIQGLMDEKVLTEVRSRLSDIKIDGILDSAYIEELIRDSPGSPFDTMRATERPDHVAGALLDGQFAILVDNTPFALMAPVTFWRSLSAPGDYYQNYWAASFYRWLRLGALFLALTLPSLYVLLTTFHQEMIPTPLALAVAAGREGTPFPTVVEVLLLDLMFEVLHEAGLRLPQAVGQTVSIVGALVIGQAAVQAGLIAPATVITVAATGLAVFSIPNYAMSTTIRLLRFPLLIISGFLGVFGFLMATILLAFHLASLRSFGTPYLGPIAPLGIPEQKDTLVRAPWWAMQKRPRLSGGARTARQAPEQKPAPPAEPHRSPGPGGDDRP